MEKPLSITPFKHEKIFIKCEIWGARLQFVNNHNAKFKYKGMKTVGVTDYINKTPSKHFDGKCLSLTIPKMSKYS